MSLHSVVVYRVGPAWNVDEPLQKQDHAIGHIRFIKRVLIEGIARLAGPYTRLDECVEGDIVGMIVFDLSVEDALRKVADDPAVKNALLVPEGRRFYPV